MKNTKHHLVFSPHYHTDLSVLGTPVDFAPNRGTLVLKALEEEFGLPHAVEYAKPQALRYREITITHGDAYINSLKQAKTWAEIFGLSTALPQNRTTIQILSRLFFDYRLKSGGTLLASRLALKYGMAANLGGGYHHAHADKGDGFCLINDVAITTNLLLKQKEVEKVMIIDLDFHQGNGNSSILHGRKEVYLLDFYAKHSWPYPKGKVNQAVPITPDEEHLYLEKLKTTLIPTVKRFKPNLVIFIQGADAYEHGLLTRGNGFKLTLAQMKERDEYVLNTMHNLGIPLALVFAGGYGPRAWEAHYQGVRHLLKLVKAIDKN
jgi:histone deacetylase 11